MAHAQKPDFVFGETDESISIGVLASVQSTTGSRCVRTPFASFLFTSPPMRHRVPSRFKWTLLEERHAAAALHVQNHWYTLS